MNAHVRSRDVHTEEERLALLEDTLDRLCTAYLLIAFRSPYPGRAGDMKDMGDRVTGAAGLLQMARLERMGDPR